jgi:prepilin-type N-terminal cleavage/methylation domain-containing protein
MNRIHITVPPPPLVKAGDLSTRRSSRGFTLVELVVVAGVVAVLLALTISVLGSVRKASKEAKTLSDIRQIAGAVLLYSTESRDKPPVVIPQPEVWPEPEWTVVEVFGAPVRSHWFGNAGIYPIVLDPFLPEAVLKGSSEWTYRYRTTRGSVLSWTPYQLTETLYASPAYWVYDRQSPAGRQAQDFSSTVLTSHKGLAWLPYAFNEAPEGLDGPPLTAGASNQSRRYCVAWFDLSASMPAWKDLLPGTRNRFQRGSDPGAFGPGDVGRPIAETTWGLAGMDRK